MSKILTISKLMQTRIMMTLVSHAHQNHKISLAHISEEIIGTVRQFTLFNNEIPMYKNVMVIVSELVIAVFIKCKSAVRFLQKTQLS